MINKKLLEKNKKLLIGEKIKVGGKTFYFEGCGPISVKFTHKISGLDTQNLSTAQLWVRYERLNPIIEEQLILLLKKMGVEE